MLEYVKGLEESWPFREAVSIHDAPDYYGGCALGTPHLTCTARCRLQPGLSCRQQSAPAGGERGRASMLSELTWGFRTCPAFVVVGGAVLSTTWRQEFLRTQCMHFCVSYSCAALLHNSRVNA